MLVVHPLSNLAALGDQDPLQPPVRGHDAFDQHFLDRSDWREILPIVLVQLLELAGLFLVLLTLEHHVTGEDAVFDGIHFGDGFAIGRFRSGGPSGVLSVRGDLFGCGHRIPWVSGWGLTPCCILVLHA